MFGFKACYEAVKKDVELYDMNPFELLGRWIIRAQQDVTFNKTMIEALKAYIDDNKIKWDD